MKKLLALILLGTICIASLNAMKRNRPPKRKCSGSKDTTATKDRKEPPVSKKIKYEEPEELGQVKSTSSAAASSSSTSKIVLGMRPTSVQTAIDEAFGKIKNKKASDFTWGFDGSYDSYGILGLDDDLVLKNLASKKGKNDIYIIDVGCGRGAWGEHAMNVLFDSEACRNSGKRFHIFIVTGGNECTKKDAVKGNVELHVFNQFKIENIDEEFSKLKNKVDLIVSHWTLRHLVDPFGTLKRMYSLLTPLLGMLLANDFLFKFNNSTTVEIFPSQNWNLLANSNVVSIFRDRNGSSPDLGHFLLMRTNDQELEIPLEYAGDVCEIPLESEHQSFSHALTVFKRVEIKQAETFFLEKENSQNSLGPCYCDNQNQTSKALYAYLLNQKLFESF